MYRPLCCLLLLGCAPASPLEIGGPPPQPAVLTASPAVAGSPLVLRLTGVPVGARATFIASPRTTAPGYCPPAIAPTCLAVPAPFTTLGAAVAGPAGAVLTVQVPDPAPPRVELQAYAGSGGSWWLSSGVVRGVLTADGDPDLDGLTSADEVGLGTDPAQADSDADGSGDGVEVLQGTDPLDGAGACGDLVEGESLLRWGVRADGDPLSDLQPLTPAPVGDEALRVVTEAAFDFALRYEVPAGRLLAVPPDARVRLLVRGGNHNVPTWQGNFPTLRLIDDRGGARTWTPTPQWLSDEIGPWVAVDVPLAGGPGWTTTGGVDPARVTALEVGADTWGAGFTLDLDGLSVEPVDRVCPLQCPGDCGGHGACSPVTATCDCELGYSGEQCEACSPGFVEVGGACAPPVEGAHDVWPNPASHTNGDAWLRVHHAELRRVEPKLLVVNFVNPSDPAAVGDLVDEVIAGFAEGSRVRGHADPAAPVQLQYQLARPVIDLRDGVGGRPPAPAGWPYQNSTLYPRRPAGEPGWGFDYAELFSEAFAARYGYPDPAAPGSFLTLCELVEQGLIHELWVVGSGDVPDVAAAEVLEHKQRYDAAGNAMPGSFESCAGNGCFDADVPVCGRSVRVGWVNYNRGPGCYLHSQGHGVESTGSRDTVPAMREWFVPFAAFDLDLRYGLPFANLYGMSCASPPCLSFPAPGEALIVHDGRSYPIDPFDGVCGNVHFPPNGRSHYDYFGADTVLSTCQGFGRHEDGGADALTPVESADWAGYSSLAPDCGGEFLVWWYQSMPGFGSGQTFADGRPMPSVWPFLFY